MIINKTGCDFVKHMLLYNHDRLAKERNALLFRRDIAPSCTYCKHGISLGFGEIACTRRGIMTEEGKCGAFRYEPTKRKPEYARTVKIADFDESEMSL